MHRAKDLYPKIYEFHNLEAAFYAARSSNRYTKSALDFSQHRQEELESLQKALESRTYRQGPYYTFTIREPKERVISALPFRDRVAQHAINNIIEPYFERRYYYHSYACRKDKGTHRAAAQLQEWVRQCSFEGRKLFALKADIHHYFASIDHERLKRLLRRLFKDEALLALLGQIIDSTPGEKGVPVGNLTSQGFANLYLTELDNFVKRDLRARHYIRYMDDFVILGEYAELAAMLEKIEAFLRDELALELNPKTAILCVQNGISFVGYRIWPDHVKIRKRSVRNMRRKIKEYERGEIDDATFALSYISWHGHASHADTHHIQAAIAKEVAEARAARAARALYLE